MVVGLNVGVELSPGVSVVATDVGLWMALPAITPAFLLTGVVVAVVMRDRRRAAAEADQVVLKEPDLDQ